MPVNNIAAEVRLVARDAVDSERKAGRLSGQFEFQPQLGTRYGVVRRLLLGPKAALPCTPPPWGTLTAVKAASGEIAWQVPLGQIPWAPKTPDAARWGSIALGGPIVTAGGLVFTAGTLDAAIYAFDVATGRQLWKGTLPTSARSTPMTYLAPNGRQFVIVAAGGHGIPEGLPLGDYLVAFALPQGAQRATDGDAVAELKEMQVRLRQAILARQRDEYASMLAPEWRVTHIDGKVLTKTEVLDMVFGSQEPPFAEASQDEIEVRLFGDAAVVTGRSFFTLRSGSRIALRFTDFIVRRNDRWLVAASHATALRE
jgi:hypothetical protein